MKPLYLSILAAVICILSGCTGKGSTQEQSGETADSVATGPHSMPDTLRVATLYSPTSYFIYRDTPMGYDYSLISTLADEKGMTMDLKVAGSLSDAVQMLDDGLVDIIAYEVPVTSEYRETLEPCGPENMTSQVLVQPNDDPETLITDVTQLVGRDIYVEANSKYQQRIENLNDELGGGINILSVARDTLITEDLIEMVSKGEIPLTVVDSDIARINKTYYPHLDITLEVGFPQRSAWAVKRSEKWLADSINAWIRAERPRKANDELMKRYFELSKISIPTEHVALDFKGGRISPYDNLFKAHTRGTNIDWRLLAAIGYVESNYRNDVTSWAGARGIMQIMPSTARAYNYSPEALDNPDVSIEVAVKIYKELDSFFADKVENPTERIKFILAAYNAGIGHIADAIALAKKTGHNPKLWYGNVEEALTLKSKPEYYNDPVCKNGYFRSGETVKYVHQVLDTYDNVSRNIKK